MRMTRSKKPSSEIVCLVDDDPAVLKSIGRLLASDGFSVRAFNKPKKFLAHVQAHPVPLVVLDICLWLWGFQRRVLSTSCRTGPACAAL